MKEFILTFEFLNIYRRYMYMYMLPMKGVVGLIMTHVFIVHIIIF